MRIAFTSEFFEFINAGRLKEGRPASPIFTLIAKLLKFRPIIFLLFLFERIFGLFLALPIPIYSTLVQMFVRALPGLPAFGGMYIRSLYYRIVLKSVASNVFIDQGVVFGHPKQVELAEFSYIDKNCLIMARTCKVGRRVHIAPRVIITGGGDFEIEDYACIATGSNIITSTEVLKDGARCSGPMVDPEQRNVLRGKVLIQRDAFIGANVTILPDVTVAPGSVAGAHAVLAKNTEPWMIYVGARTQKFAEREKVRWRD